MKVSELKNLIENVISKEVRNKIISESKEVYHIKCEGIPLATFVQKVPLPLVPAA